MAMLRGATGGLELVALENQKRNAMALKCLLRWTGSVPLTSSAKRQQRPQTTDLSLQPILT